MGLYGQPAAPSADSLIERYVQGIFLLGDVGGIVWNEIGNFEGESLRGKEVTLIPHAWDNLYRKIFCAFGEEREREQRDLGWGSGGLAQDQGCNSF